MYQSNKTYTRDINKSQVIDDYKNEAEKVIQCDIQMLW